MADAQHLLFFKDWNSLFNDALFCVSDRKHLTIMKMASTEVIFVKRSCLFDVLCILLPFKGKYIQYSLRILWGYFGSLNILFVDN